LIIRASELAPDREFGRHSWSTERALANNNHRDLNPQSLVSVVVRTYWFVSELR
jgi:hypothetical protein